MVKPSKATLQARSETLDKEIARHDLEVKCGELEAQLSQMGQQLVEAGANLSKAMGAEQQARNAYAGMEKLKRDTDEQNNTLRDQVHYLELDRARLEGLLERVREFDPVTPREEYRGELQHSIARDGHDYANLAGMANGRRQPWYRRLG